MSEIIHLNKVFKKYSLKDTSYVLKNINCHIDQGDFVAITGVSGSGKSTLLNLIGCIDKHDSGKIEICKQNINSLSDKQLTCIRRNHIGFIFQLFNLIQTLSVLDNIRYSQYIRLRKMEDQKILEVAKRLGLQTLLKKRPNELSGGQAQRVAIARAIISSPDIILADEPTANLDSATSHQIIKLLEELRKELNLTVVLATHDEKITAFANKQFNINDGELMIA